MVPVSTLRALAQRTYIEYGHEKVLTAFDARMDEVYWAEYALGDHEIMQLQSEEQVISPDNVRLQLSQQIQINQENQQNQDNRGWSGSGSGWAAYEGKLKQAIGTDLVNVYPDMITRADEIVMLAHQDFQLGKAVSAENALPVYLRNKVAKKKST